MLGNAGRRADVLRVIALDGPIPRTRIADALGVSSATVTTITRELIESGLVTMSGKRPASGRRGRPLEMLSIAPDAATVLGAKVSDDHVTAVTTDLRGSITGRWVLPFDPREDDAAGRLARLLLDTVGDVPLVGVGLGVPGTVASGDAGAVTTPMFGWRDLPLGSIASDVLGVPVVVDNDVNTLATWQHLHGAARDVENFLTVTIGRGIGLGVHLDGAVRRGRGGAGELGHTLVIIDGPPCDCGRRGCLEAIAAEPAMVAQARDRGIIGPDDGIDDLRLLAKDSEEAAEVFATAGAHLGRAVANLVNLLAPDAIVVAGEGVVAWPLLAEGFVPAFEAGILDVHTDTTVIVEPWADDAWAQGAAALVLGWVLGASPDTAGPSASSPAGDLFATDSDGLGQGGADHEAVTA